jgi:hypothetical protein
MADRIGLFARGLLRWSSCSSGLGQRLRSGEAARGSIGSDHMREVPMPYQGAGGQTIAVWRPRDDVLPLAGPTSTVRFVVRGAVTGGGRGDDVVAE